MNDLASSYRLLREQAGSVALARDGVRVAGPDAAAFLQGQLSQDVLALPPGGVTESLVLAPTGKVDAYIRVIRMAEAEFVLDIDGGFGSGLVERLARFKLRTKADVDLVPWAVIAVRGPASPTPPPDPEPGVVVVPSTWPGMTGFDVAGPPDGVRAALADLDVASCDPGAYDTIRIEAGIPAMGAELDETTIPAEAGVVDRSVSFTKGCFTGQELVARIDSRGGNVPRRLRGIVLEGAAVPERGATVRAGGRDVGLVTSASYSPGLEAPVALAYVHRSVEPPAAVEVGSAGGEVAAEVRGLPLVA